jgi:hypothetical protein
MMRLGALLGSHDGDDRDRALREFARAVLEASDGTARELAAAVDAAGADLLERLDLRARPGTPDA